MGQQDRAVRCEQFVEPAIGGASFDDCPKAPQRFDRMNDGCGVFATNGQWFGHFSSIVHGCDHHGFTVQINTNVPHEQVSLFGGGKMD